MIIIKAAIVDNDERVGDVLDFESKRKFRDVLRSCGVHYTDEIRRRRKKKEKKI